MRADLKVLERSAAVTGIGQSEVGRRLNADPLALTADACLAAIEDAGLTRADIDGLSTYPGGSMAAGALAWLASICCCFASSRSIRCISCSTCRLRSSISPALAGVVNANRMIAEIDPIGNASNLNLSIKTSVFAPERTTSTAPLQPVPGC